ncbi:acyl-CoA dehydrogenase family protein [Sphaerisporangium sp. NPDC051017]|uniref:acyl-CoA dehydrogenase family protein n=1 Tax=Sphaerisporangium sp. NPDC051017 TaxID=3154636 RepID=UPI00341866BE
MLTEERRALVAALQDFCRRECGTREQRAELTGGGRHAHNAGFYGKLAEAGYLGISIPEEYGGAGGDLFDLCLLHEELYRGMAPVHAIGSTHTVAGVLKRFGNEDQKKAVLGGIAGGAPMSISISEPEAGSDAANISCRATKVDGGYRIDGLKTWCSAADHATGGILVVVRTGRGDKPQHGLTMLLVPSDAPGLTIKPIETMGGPLVNDLYFTDVFVPESDLVGVEGQAWPQLMAGLNGERLVAAAEALGMAERTLEDLLSYVKERKQFGKAIGSFQAVRHRIADLVIEVEASKALTYSTVGAVIENSRPVEEIVRLTSVTKVKLTETAKTVALEGVQLMGGYGYAVEYGMEAHLREAIAPTIYAGTNEIQREVISSTLGLR